MGRVCKVWAAPPSVVIIDQTIFLDIIFTSESGEIQGFVYHKAKLNNEGYKKEGR